MRLHPLRLFDPSPQAPRILDVPDEFFLLRIHRDHRPALRQIPFDRRVDVPKLCVTVRMIASFLGLTIALKAVVERVQELGDFRMADRMPAVAQCLGKVRVL